MRWISVLYLLFSIAVFSQGNDVLAKEYYKNGDYEKALIEYKKLFSKSSLNINYVLAIVDIHQQLEQYDEAENFLNQIMPRINYPAFVVELGYNHQLKNDSVAATNFYNKALKSIEERPSYVFSVTNSFKKHALFNEAIKAYEIAMHLKPDYNFSYQLAQLYGEQGKIEEMFNKYIDFVIANPTSLNSIKRPLNDFITEDATNGNNILLRKVLLKKNQQAPHLIYNELLSWLFIQQKEYNKAFVQEKAIFNRNPESLSKIEELAEIATKEQNYNIAKDIFGFIVETAQDIDMVLNAELYLLQIEIKLSNRKDYDKIDTKFQVLFSKYGLTVSTLQLQVAYVHFLAFYQNKAENAIVFLEKSLELPLNDMQMATVKLQLGDILVLREQFNKALIYYTQIQRNLKNSTISQMARYKVAKTSYYKGDFKWAESQLNILKSSTSQLIANDALDLKLLISDNKHEDSLQIALKSYAKADLLAFQNKNEAAITLLEQILKDHKTEPIVPQALFKQAQLFEVEKEFEKAIVNYQHIIDHYADSVLIDDTLFYLAEIYEKQLLQNEKAKALYEQIVFNHEASIYFVDARKRYRTLRGDNIN
ncbi:MAG: tetratricopeptide repeat protein [Aestuariibaculum sp.]